MIFFNHLIYYNRKMQYFWSVKESIRHSGVIERIENDVVFVKIVQLSACSGCQAKSLCKISESKEKIVEVRVPDVTAYKVGDPVVVTGTASQGAKAVVLAFGLPLIILLSVLIVLTQVTGDEAKSALIALLIMVPYYAVLYICRNRIKRVFQFSIRK